MRNAKDYSVFDSFGTFESNAENPLNSRRLTNLYDSDKWELGNRREKGRGHDERRKDHRANALNKLFTKF